MTAPTHLRSVGDDNTTQQATRATTLPSFEGHVPDFSRIKLTAVADLEISGDSETAHLDDVVRMFIEGKVVGIDHKVDNKTGKLLRIHTIRVIEAVALPWNFDTGVFDG